MDDLGVPVFSETSIYNWKGSKPLERCSKKNKFRLDVPDFTLGDSWVEPAVNFSRVCILLKFHSLEEIGFQKKS